MGAPFIWNGVYSKNLLSALRLGSLAADPASPAAGDFYFNSTINQFKYYSGTAWVILQGAASVAARYHSATATVTSSDSTLTYSTSDFDTNSAYALGTYTVPAGAGGYYAINANVSISATFALGNNNAISIYVNGVQKAEKAFLAFTGATILVMDINDILNLNAGDTVVIKVRSAGTTPTITVSAVDNLFSIAQIAATTGPAALAVTTKTANYTAGTSDNLILCSGAAFTVTLYTAVGNTGRQVIVKKTDASFANIITIATTGGQTVDGISTTTVNTQYEAVTLVSDGTNWQIIDRKIPATVIDNGAVTVTGTTSNPTLGTTSVNRLVYYRNGGSLVGRIEINLSLAGSIGSGDYLFQAVPSGLTIDTAKVTPYTTVLGGASWQPSNIVGQASMSQNTPSCVTGPVIVYDTTNVRLFGLNGGSQGAASSSFYSTGNNGTTYTATFTVPISGWNG